MSRQCKRCLGPLAPHAVWGICRRNPACSRAAAHMAERAYRTRHRPTKPHCQLCEKELAVSRKRTIFICTTSGRCLREYMRLYARQWRLHPSKRQSALDHAQAWRDAHRAAHRATRRQYYRRTMAVLRSAGVRFPTRYWSDRSYLLRLSVPVSEPRPSGRAEASA